MKFNLLRKEFKLLLKLTTLLLYNKYEGVLFLLNCSPIFEMKFKLIIFPFSRNAVRSFLNWGEEKFWFVI